MKRKTIEARRAKTVKLAEKKLPSKYERKHRNIELPKDDSIHQN